jgi:hypothetical protein
VLPYEKVDVTKYLKNTVLGTRTVSYHSSIGCPFTCSFCAVTKNYAGRWMAETPERTIDTVRWLHGKYGINGIEFHDSNFFTAEKRVAAFSEGVMDLGIGWWGEVRLTPSCAMMTAPGVDARRGLQDDLHGRGERVRDNAQVT